MTTSEQTQPEFGATYRAGDRVRIITMYGGGEREVFTVESVIGPHKVRITGRRLSRETRELAMVET